VNFTAAYFPDASSPNITVIYSPNEISCLATPTTNIMVDFNDFAQIAHEASKDRAKVKTSTPVATTTPISTTPSDIKTSADGAQAGPPRTSQAVTKSVLQVWRMRWELTAAVSTGQRLHVLQQPARRALHQPPQQGLQQPAHQALRQPTQQALQYGALQALQQPAPY
jgi:hypothetical protein